MGLGSGQAAAAYLVSLSAVRAMIDRYGMYRVKMVLDEPAAGADMGKALSAGIMNSYAEFEREWKGSLE